MDELSEQPSYEGVASEVIEGFLYLSDLSFVKLKNVKDFGVIINAMFEVKYSPPTDIEFHHFPLIDAPCERIDRYFKEFTALVEGARIRNKRVLVHCKEGISRAPTLVLSYLISSGDTNGYLPGHIFSPLERSIYFLKNKRSIVDPNYGFLNQLRDYAEMKLRSDHFDFFRRRNFFGDVDTSESSKSHIPSHIEGSICRVGRIYTYDLKNFHLFKYGNKSSGYYSTKRPQIPSSEPKIQFGWVNGLFLGMSGDGNWGKVMTVNHVFGVKIRRNQCKFDLPIYRKLSLIIDRGNEKIEKKDSSSPVTPPKKTNKKKESPSASSQEPYSKKWFKEVHNGFVSPSSTFRNREYIHELMMRVHRLLPSLILPTSTSGVDKEKDIAFLLLVFHQKRSSTSVTPSDDDIMYELYGTIENMFVKYTSDNVTYETFSDCYGLLPDFLYLEMGTAMVVCVKGVEEGNLNGKFSSGSDVLDLLLVDFPIKHNTTTMMNDAILFGSMSGLELKSSWVKHLQNNLAKVKFPPCSINSSSNLTEEEKEKTEECVIIGKNGRFDSISPLLLDSSPIESTMYGKEIFEFVLQEVYQGDWSKALKYGNVLKSDLEMKSLEKEEELCLKVLEECFRMSKRRRLKRMSKITKIRISKVSANSLICFGLSK